MPLLFYSFHIMVGLGTIFIALMTLCGAAALARQAVRRSSRLLWALMLLLPFPYIANTAGWMTAELGPPTLADLRPDAHQRRLLAACLGRQHAVHAAGLHGHVHACSAFCSCFLMYREIEHGPGAVASPPLHPPAVHY